MHLREIKDGNLCTNNQEKLISFANILTTIFRNEISQKWRIFDHNNFQNKNLVKIICHLIMGEESLLFIVNDFEHMSWFCFRKISLVFKIWMR